MSLSTAKLNDIENTKLPENVTPTIAEIRRPPPVRLVPPLNFALAERQLYRSGQPAPINFPFLQGLNLKTIVWLAVEDPSDAFLGFADNNEIEFHHLGLVTEGGNPWDQLTESSIVSALDIIMNVKSYPLLVCCGMGRHRTGTVIGCLRRLQGWNFASISDEYRRFVGAKGGRVLIELHIEAFDTKSIQINMDSAPDWFTNTKRQSVPSPVPDPTLVPGSASASAPVPVPVPVSSSSLSSDL